MNENSNRLNSFLSNFIFSNGGGGHISKDDLEYVVSLFYGGGEIYPNRTIPKIKNFIHAFSDALDKYTSNHQEDKNNDERNKAISEAFRELEDLENKIEDYSSGPELPLIISGLQETCLSLEPFLGGARALDQELEEMINETPEPKAMPKDTGKTFWLDFIQDSGVKEPDVNQVVTDFVELDVDSELVDEDIKNTVKFVDYVIMALEKQENHLAENKLHLMKKLGDDYSKRLDEAKMNLKDLQNEIKKASANENYNVAAKIITFLKNFGWLIISPIVSMIHQRNEMKSAWKATWSPMQTKRFEEFKFAFKRLKTELEEVKTKEKTGDEKVDTETR